jgi:hypothetical protein
MTRSYDEIEEFNGYFLEESYVLSINAQPGTVVFRLNFALTTRHANYFEPLPGEQFCYVNGTLIFSGVSSLTWDRQGSPPAVDATGEVDYGNIDTFSLEASTYQLSGDWGLMRLQAENARMTVDK